MNSSTVIDCGWDRILKDTEKIKGASIEAGLFGEGNNAADNIAYRGFINEYGLEIIITEKMRGYLHVIGIHVRKATDKIVIPSRPFMRQAFENNQGKLFEYIEKWYTDVIEGKMTLHVFFSKIGVLMTSHIKMSIRSGGWTKNHPITIERKGSSRPLIDKGEMIDSIKFEFYYGSIGKLIMNEGL